MPLPIWAILPSEAKKQEVEARSFLDGIPRHELYRQLRERDVTGGMKRRTGMSTKKLSFEKARGAGRRKIVAAVVMAEATMRTMMKSVRTARAMLTRQL